MKIANRNRTLGNHISAIAAVALIGLGFATTINSPAVADEQLAMKTERPIASFSKIFKTVEQRPDYGMFVSVRYDTQARAYDFRYTADDGTAKTLKIDAVTGDAISAVASQETR
jgi:uncharacterized membrane protein YkoI